MAFNNTNKKILLAGPWVGEFGWELFCWQGYVRELSKQFDKTIIISRKGNKFLYKDFADEYYSFDAPFSKINMWLGETDQNKLNESLKNIKYTNHLKPFNIGYSPLITDLQLSRSKFLQQKYIKYSSDTLDESYDILIHPRNKVVGDKRNWSKENFQKLVNKLSEKYSVAIIGSEETHLLDNVVDKRGISIVNLVSLMNRSKLVVGQSSGPMHLASLSGAPHFVWSDYTNENRYKKHWNPFNTPIYFYKEEDWNPTVNNLYNKIIEVL